MDYTLAIYEETMEHLQAEMALERLAERYGYPQTVLQAKYQPNFAIRGLAVDMAHGNVFKMDSHRFVGRVWHGAGPLERELRKQTYTNRKLTPADPSIVMVDTLFSLPEISLYCQLVQLLHPTPVGAVCPSTNDACTVPLLPITRSRAREVRPVVVVDPLDTAAGLKAMVLWISTRSFLRKR